MVLAMSEKDSESISKSPRHQKVHHRRALQKVLSELPNVPERVVYNFSLKKCETERFGITIVGGLGTTLGGIYIKTISPHGVCGYDGNLKIGDQILLINRHDMRNQTHAEAVECFHKSKTALDIIVLRMVESKVQKDESNISAYHRRIVSACDGWDDEPAILEHKEIEDIEEKKTHFARNGLVTLR